MKPVILTRKAFDISQNYDGPIFFKEEVCTLKIDDGVITILDSLNDILYTSKIFGQGAAKKEQESFLKLNMFELVLKDERGRTIRDMYDLMRSFVHRVAGPVKMNEGFIQTILENNGQLWLDENKIIHLFKPTSNE
jgi:hypothetical protein